MSAFYVAKEDPKGKMEKPQGAREATAPGRGSVGDKFMLKPYVNIRHDGTAGSRECRLANAHTHTQLVKTTFEGEMAPMRAHIFASIRPYVAARLFSHKRYGSGTRW